MEAIDSFLTVGSATDMLIRHNQSRLDHFAGQLDWADEAKAESELLTRVTEQQRSIDYYARQLDRLCPEVAAECKRAGIDSGPIYRAVDAATHEQERFPELLSDVRVVLRQVRDSGSDQGEQSVGGSWQDAELTETQQNIMQAVDELSAKHPGDRLTSFEIAKHAGCTDNYVRRCANGALSPWLHGAAEGYRKVQ